jgi:hypothetical protein
VEKNLSFALRDRRFEDIQFETEAIVASRLSMLSGKSDAAKKMKS